MFKYFARGMALASFAFLFMFTFTTQGVFAATASNTTTIGTHSTSIAGQSPDLTQQMIKLLPANYQAFVKEGPNGSFTVDAKVQNQKVVHKAITDAFKKVSSQLSLSRRSGASPLADTSCPVSNSGNGYDGLNAYVYTTLNTWGCNQGITMSGTTDAGWAAGTPSYIIVKSQVVLNGASASINISSSPSAGFSSTANNIASYSGQFNSTPDAGHSYAGLQGWSSFPWSVDQSDGATIRVGNHDYDPNDKVTIVLPW